MTFMMIVSSFIFSFSFNTIGTIIQEIDKDGKDFQKKMRVVHKYFEEKNIDKELRSGVYKFLEYKFKSEVQN
jgi:hypothetical protein